MSSNNSQGPPNPVRVSGGGPGNLIPLPRGHALVPSRTAPPPAVLSGTPNLVGLLTALRRRWLLAAGLATVSAALLGGLAWFVIPDKYKARTQLRVFADQPRIIFRTEEDRTEFKNYQRAQIAMVKSRLVLNAALRDPKVANLPAVKDRLDAVSWLEKQVDADFALAPEILSISVTGDNEKEAVDLANAVREAYLREIVEKEQELRVKRLDKLKSLYDKYDDHLRTKRQKLREAQESIGSRDPGSLNLQHQFALAQLHNIQMEYLQMQSQLRKLQTDIDGHKSKDAAIDKATVSEKLIEEWVNKDSLVQRYNRDLKRLTEEADLLKQRLARPGRESSYKGALARLEAAKASLAARVEKIRPGIVEELRGKLRLELQSGRLEAERQLASLQGLKKIVEREVQLRTKEVTDLRKNTVDVEWLRDDIVQFDDLAKTVGKQIQALQVELEAPSRVRLLEDAVASPPSANRARLAGLAGFGAFGLAVFGVAFLEFRVRRVTCVDDIVHGLQMRVVGTLPLLPASARQGSPGSQTAKGRRWHTLLTESVDAARAMLAHLARQDSLKVVMVTSAGGGEGKTVLSCHLAASLARAGWKTLLIDGDLRRPSVHRLFNLPLQPGLSEILRGEVQGTAAVQPGSVAGLDILPAGQADSEAIRRLGQQALAAALEKFREQYDFVIVDSAPVLPVADSQLIAQYTDGVLFSILRDISRLPSVHTAHDRLAMLGARILGAVVTGTKAVGYGPGYEYSSVPAGTAS